MDDVDRAIVARLQDAFPVSERPFREAADALGLTEETLIARIAALLRDGTLTRFGPLFDIERMGGEFTLAALAVPEARFEEVAATVNTLPEVAHNYARAHRLNMWFVLATERPGRIAELVAEISKATGLEVVNLPKLEEYFLELKLAA